MMAAFLNALREEGTKDDCLRMLEKMWTDDLAARAEIAALRAQVERLTAHRKQAGDALLRFTPSGSEYFLCDNDGFRVDPDACAAIIQNKMDKLHEARRTVALQRKEIERLTTITEDDVERSCKAEYNKMHEGIYGWHELQERYRSVYRESMRAALLAFVKQE